MGWFESYIGLLDRAKIPLILIILILIISARYVIKLEGATKFRGRMNIYGRKLSNFIIVFHVFLSSSKLKYLVII